MASSGINRIFLERHPFQLTLVALWVLVALYFVTPVVDQYRFITLHKIIKSGEITIITSNAPHCYYIYRDESMGFEYDLVKAFADYLGVGLNVKIAENWDGMVSALNKGNGSLIAAGIAITPKRKKQVAFCDGYLEIQQYLIAHRNTPKIRKIEDLSGKTVHVRKATLHQERLEELQRQGIDLTVKQHKDVPAEELIQQVAEREIEFTVADSNIALLNRRHYPGAIMASPISDRQQLGWAVHPQAHQLLEKINSFFKSIKENGKLAEIYDRYYGDVEEFDYVDLRAFHHSIQTKLSRFQPFIKAVAEKHGFDWRLIAAQIYQESHLNPWAQSHAGAKGLMQILPSTAQSLGVNDIYNPVENINAGVQHLKNLYDRFEGMKEEDRLLIALAAYNVGHGHIEDARNLADDLNLNPNSWESLARTLPMLTYRRYYKKAKYGYCRGNEPVDYTKQIMIYFDILKRQGIEYGAEQAKLQDLRQ
jgi:membrane-bound lytic murein transglycosylase F